MANRCPEKLLDLHPDSYHSQFISIFVYRLIFPVIPFANRDRQKTNNETKHNVLDDGTRTDSTQ